MRTLVEEMATAATMDQSSDPEERLVVATAACALANQRIAEAVERANELLLQLCNVLEEK
jgi:hypothetical protein